MATTRPVIALVELAERFSYYGSSVVFVSRLISFPIEPRQLKHIFPLDKLHSVSSTRWIAHWRWRYWRPIRSSWPETACVNRLDNLLPILVSYFFLLIPLPFINIRWRCYVTPLLGAYIADTYWGRYKTICVAVGIAFVGHIIMIVSSVPGVIEKNGAIGAFVVSLIVTGFGTGLFKANISPLVAEQYKRTKLFVITTETGERVIVDPALTVSRVYMASLDFQKYLRSLLISSIVLLSFHQHWSIGWTDRHDLFWKGDIHRIILCFAIIPNCIPLACRLLAGVHTSNRRFPSLPHCSCCWSKPIYSLAAHRFRSC